MFKVWTLSNANFITSLVVKPSDLWTLWYAKQMVQRSTLLNCLSTSHTHVKPYNSPKPTISDEINLLFELYAKYLIYIQQRKRWLLAEKCWPSSSRQCNWEKKAKIYGPAHWYGSLWTSVEIDDLFSVLSVLSLLWFKKCFNDGAHVFSVFLL